ncbi:unnamed protein product [Euphydryas editha]|uniref:Uncharacterized protein n=1 Tax=Euphydryas editha TaxID=104508 RepID=A0AAU9TLK3_EUPED|nr:unnamed protein product [Euphydryas editha]
MQFHQPFGNLAFDSKPYNVYYQTIPSYTQVIGEGEVNSVFIPDGSVQMYFIPTARYDRWPPYPNINNFNKNQNIESWFIRSISLPISTSLSNQFLNPYGDRLSTRLFTPDYNSALPFCAEYCQKFHNDNTTSTTDIMYFYPSLRQNKILQNNALVQTNTATANYVSYDGVNKECNCKVSFRIGKEINGRCLCQDSASYMSVDSMKNKTSDQSIDKKKYRRSKHKCQSRRRKHRDHICECNVGVKSTSDKLVTTYNDRACGNVPREGRDTQTKQKSKRSDIKTEIWVPIKGKSTNSKCSINSLKECTSCSDSNICSCSSTTNADSQ